MGLRSICLIHAEVLGFFRLIAERVDAKQTIDRHVKTLHSLAKRPIPPTYITQSVSHADHLLGMLKVLEISARADALAGSTDVNDVVVVAQLLTRAADICTRAGAIPYDCTRLSTCRACLRIAFGIIVTSSRASLFNMLAAVHIKTKDMR